MSPNQTKPNQTNIWTAVKSDFKLLSVNWIYIYAIYHL